MGLESSLFKNRAILMFWSKFLVMLGLACGERIDWSRVLEGLLLAETFYYLGTCIGRPCFKRLLTYLLSEKDVAARSKDDSLM